MSFLRPSVVRALCALLPACAVVVGCGDHNPPPTTAPFFSVAAGTYNKSVAVALQNSTSGATIHYWTVVGVTQCSPQTYSAQLQLTQPTTIYAYASSPGLKDSSIVSAMYDVELPPAPPTFSPPGGSYTTQQTVAISDSTANARIFYTLDGTVPSPNSALYANPLNIAVTTTVHAIAVGPNGAASDAAIASYKITLPHHAWGCLFGCVPSAPCNNPAVPVLSAATWIDAHDVPWFFGGAQDTGFTTFNSGMSKLDFAAGFQLVGGSKSTNLPGVYGTLGTAAAGNIPGARAAAYTWVDNQGRFWLFGGTGVDANGTVGLLNDLWQYTPATGQWAWMGGSSHVAAPGIYGTRNTAGATNIPGARTGGVTWRDAAGNFYLFGATGYDSAGTRGPLNDLWKFSPVSGQWTWVAGSNVAGASASFGMLGLPSASNTPGAYDDVSAPALDSAGNLLLFAGSGTAANNATGLLNTGWQFNPSTGSWTWITGANTVGASASYGTLGVASSANLPGARSLGLGWTDASGNLWTFGGNGVDSAGKTDLLNDLWEFDTVAHAWTWIGGSNTVDASPVMSGAGNFSSTNTPGARKNANIWVDSQGNVYVMGGYGYDNQGTRGYLKDLWRFNP